MNAYSKNKECFVSRAEGLPSMPAMHYHPYYELYYLDSGSREYFVEDKFFAISSGDFALIGPHKFHRTGNGYALRTIVGFTEEFLLKTYTPAAVKHMVKCFDKIVINPPEGIHAELKGMIKILSECTNPTDFAINLGYLLQKLSQCKPDTSYEKRISSIIKYINQNFSDIDSIDQIADQMHISKHYLCRLFKDSTGITLIDYLTTIKVKNACTFLETSDKDISEISELCGFNSSAYFSNVFKKIMLESPTRYRKKYMKE